MIPKLFEIIMMKLCKNWQGKFSDYFKVISPIICRHCSRIVLEQLCKLQKALFRRAGERTAVQGRLTKPGLWRWFHINLLSLSGPGGNTAGPTYFKRTFHWYCSLEFIGVRLIVTVVERNNGRPAGNNDGNLDYSLILQSYNAVITNFLQISGHTFIVIYADVLTDVFNLIGCAHYNSSNVFVL
jgi:hypothetical protein